MQSLNTSIQKHKNYFDFLFAMTEKEIKARYKKAVFGFLWVILNPLLQMTIIGIIFSFFIKIPNYYLFLFTGLLPWQFFSLSLSKATPSVVFERGLLQKAKFPIEAIPISIILSNFFNMIVSLVLLFFILFIIGKLSFVGLILVIPVVVWLLFFTVGLSLITASFQVKYRDVNFFMQTILTLWFYATPVLYTIDLIPQSLHFIFNLNPLTTIFELMHLLILGRGMVSTQLVYSNLIETVLVVVIGIWIFRRESKFFIDWL